LATPNPPVDEPTIGRAKGAQPCSTWNDSLPSVDTLLVPAVRRVCLNP
jgi:hypothetical protein